jgi:hypothetical protein
MSTTIVIEISSNQEKIEDFLQNVTKTRIERSIKHALVDDFLSIEDSINSVNVSLVDRKVRYGK